VHNDIRGEQNSGDWIIGGFDLYHGGRTGSLQYHSAVVAATGQKRP
jgi:hypothetical protein